MLVSCEQSRAPFGVEASAEPALFAPGIVSSEDNLEYGIAFSPDGREVYFTRSTGGRRGRPRIMVSRVVEGAWSEAEPASFSTGWEETPFITQDGRWLYYSSRRDIPGWGPVRGSNNLWRVERGPDGWANEQPLSGEVNRPRVDGEGTPGRSETSPIVLGDGTLLYSTEDEPERGSDIYVADRSGDRYTNPRPMLLNTAGDESNPTMSPDGRWLVFQGYRHVFAPSDDLYVSERTEFGWSEPRPLPAPINTPFTEAYPRFSPDGSLLFFASDRGPGRMSIYYVSAEAAGLTPETVE